MTTIARNNDNWRAVLGLATLILSAGGCSSSPSGEVPPGTFQCPEGSTSDWDNSCSPSGSALGGGNPFLFFPLRDSSIECTTYKGHPQDGCDLVVPTGTSVGAPVAGIVYVAKAGCTDNEKALDKEYSPYKDCNGGAGNYIIIRTDDGNDVWLEHLQSESLMVKEKDVVCAGDEVAKSGASGNVYSSFGGTGAHLHVATKVNGGWIYPDKLWLDKNALKLGSTPKCNGGSESCSDKRKNGGETDLDCGGGSCPTCPVGRTCGVNADCSSDLCIGETCVVCGGQDQPCCANAACNNGLQCSGGSCSAPPCGGNGQMCCNGNVCNNGLQCSGGFCGAPPCGGNGQMCCNGNVCNNGFQCSGGFCGAPPCGGNGQMCCNGNVCNNGLVCGGNICAAPICPAGDGAYCGGHGVGGNVGTLYQCTNGALRVLQVCAVSCVEKPPRVDDVCAPCPTGDGFYCGGHGVIGNVGSLYQCLNGGITLTEVCAKGCTYKPAFQNDVCTP